MEIGRRETLFAALALIAPAAVVRAAGQLASPGGDPETFQLIARHHSSHAAHNEACGWIDDIALGRSPTPEEEARYVIARESDWDARLMLCAHAPRTVCGAVAKAEHLRAWLLRDDFTAEDIDALLSSVAQAVDANGRGA